MNAPVTTTTLADGVYFGLPDDLYHDDLALGSTDLKLLAAAPEDWWHGSKLNPNREPRKITPAFLFGRAVHKIVLEGRAAFDREYRATRYPGNVKAGKEEREYIASIGAIALSLDDHTCAVEAGAAIAANPHLAASFTGGMPEVSVVWTDPTTGLRFKVRQDYVKPRATVDLKSIRPQRPAPFAESCLRAIGEHRYHGQAAHYTDGRAAMLRFIADGALYGDHDPAWLKGLRAEAAFVFVFYQAEGAPLTWGTKISPSSGVIANGRARIARGVENFRTYSDRFALGQPWITHAPLDELDIDELPAWALN